MTAPGNDIIESLLGVLIVASCCYAAGRLHQWLRQGTERDDAFRQGYDSATRSLWSLTMRTLRRPAPATPEPNRVATPGENRRRITATATVVPINTARASSRHSYDDLQAPTKDLSTAV